ncbi:hypothetical protein [Paenisporosarcina indica]|uniref:hypothetical protein n=1 Tax=Paenisporosarcina indica TaxID=650093 RepID=UPI000A7996F6|nr:hypothetical protein [Paenisporosarcina indica]
MEKSRNDQDLYTIAGTSIDDVISQNERSGLTFNELNKIFEDEEIIGQHVDDKRKNQQ